MEVGAIVNFASKISTPLILSGVVVGVLWGVFKLVVQKSPVWEKKDALPIVIRIINWIGILALISVLLGFTGFFITESGFKFHRPDESSPNQQNSGLLPSDPPKVEVELMVVDSRAVRPGLLSTDDSTPPRSVESRDNE